MASFVAGGAAKAVFGDIQREWGQAVGGLHSSPAANEPQIDWGNLNYPPCVRLFHYDPSEIPAAAARIVRPIHWLFIFTSLINVLNLVDNIVLVCGGVTFYRAVFSVLNFFILIPVSGWIFYEGYCAVALSSAKKLNKYMILQGIMTVLYLLFVLLPFGAFNGLGALAVRNSEDNEKVSDSTKQFWMICVIYESVLWLVAAGWSGFNMWRAKSFNPYHSQEARAAA